ncbi:hypothetical protein [Mangrovibacter yixingensis]|uniref:hypothetical protein n=1 Tax=Mangrovibacter yixingensis TaxID=1529639 RepID=UPI001CFB859D|nr:hypothetical protein [Mangrovibacter yixingensis]
MKKYIYVIFLAVLFLVIFIFMKMSEPTSQQAISFVKKQILNGASEPDSINFSHVGFFPTPEQKYGSLRGSVCGIFSEKPNSSADSVAVRKRFVANIEVSERGRSAKMSQPIIETGNNSKKLEILWSQQCR